MDLPVNEAEARAILREIEDMINTLKIMHSQVVKHCQSIGVRENWIYGYNPKPMEFNISKDCSLDMHCMGCSMLATAPGYSFTALRTAGPGYPEVP